jgi:1,5-anhydro-D-fructose reductase (1,5-anhydro-D-mannitol-forming)
MSDRSIIRWGILGCGNVCEVKSGPGFQKAQGSALVAVMRRDAAKAEDYANRHGVPRWYADADRLIDDPEVDAVYVATPPESHLELALRVAAAAKPCYVEKPMARSHAECARMVAAFDAARLPLFVAYYRRRLPRFVKVKELVDAGRLGTITDVLVRLAQPKHRNPGSGWRLDAAVGGAGLFLDLASHTLDVLDFILGPLHDVGGVAANLASPYDVEDVVAMHFRAGGGYGAVGTGVWNFAAARGEDRIEITGTDGRVVLSTFGNEPVRFEDRDGKTESFDLPNPEHVQQPLIQTIVDELRGRAPRGHCPGTGTSAARTSRVMDDVLAGYYGGRDDAFWTRPQTWSGRRVGL